MRVRSPTQVFPNPWAYSTDRYSLITELSCSCRTPGPHRTNWCCRVDYQSSIPGGELGVNSCRCDPHSQRGSLHCKPPNYRITACWWRRRGEKLHVPDSGSKVSQSPVKNSQIPGRAIALSRQSGPARSPRAQERSVSAARPQKCVGATQAKLGVGSTSAIRSRERSNCS